VLPRQWRLGSAACGIVCFALDKLPHGRGLCVPVQQRVGSLRSGAFPCIELQRAAPAYLGWRLTIRARRVVKRNRFGRGFLLLAPDDRQHPLNATVAILVLELNHVARPGGPGPNW
jgi:hypothetical protein